LTLVIDAAPLVALADAHEPRRGEILDLLRAERGGLFIPAPVTAEIDHMLDQRFGAPARRAFLEDLAARRYESPGLNSTDYQAALDLDRRYVTSGRSGRSRAVPSPCCPPTADRQTVRSRTARAAPPS
jgi:hypothetical protein